MMVRQQTPILFLLLVGCSSDLPVAGTPDASRAPGADAMSPAPYAAATSGSVDASMPPGRRITGITFHADSDERHGRGADQWPLTWHDDGSLYASWGDGFGFRETGEKCYVGYTVLTGTLPGGLAGDDIYCETVSSFPNRKPRGFISVDGTLYSLTTNIDSSGNDTDVHKSTNDGASWSPHQNLFRGVDGAQLSGFVHFGQSYSGIPSHLSGDYVYAVMTDWLATNVDEVKPLYLARGPREDLLNASAWQWFTGTDASGEGQWGSIDERDAIVDDAAENNVGERGGPGWFQTIMVYHPEFQQYVLSYFHDRQGGLTVLVGDRPWGPFDRIWHEPLLDTQRKFTVMMLPSHLDKESVWFMWSGAPFYDEVHFIAATLATSP